MFWIATGIGIVATLLEVGSYLCRARSGILAWQVASALCWTVHFLLLEAGTGMAMNLIGAVRQAVFFHRGRSHWAGWGMWPWVFGILFTTGAAAAWDGPRSILPLAAMLISTAAFWQMRTKSLRLIAMIPPPLWFIYNLSCGSWPGMVTEVTILVSQLAGFLRWEKKIAPGPESG